MIIEKNKSVAVSLLKFIKLLPKKEMDFISFLRFFIRVKAL